MVSSCDHFNVGFPNCGDEVRCQGEYGERGSTRTLKATSNHCSYANCKTDLSLDKVLQLDADTFITSVACSPLENLAFWFFQTVDIWNAREEPTPN
mmetsp:Transcript_111980/g.280574  ORF Transcript_111980/g.280574 Transcript_111980/m.280574 type:complete len:96 (-) Transcript_111980:28-315(-)